MNTVLESDCVIFGTPVYWFGPSGQMKCFIDRWACRMVFDDEGFRARMRGIHYTSNTWSGGISLLVVEAPIKKGACCHLLNNLALC